MSCIVGHRRSSDLALLRHRPVAVALIQPLAMGTALKSKIYIFFEDSKLCVKTICFLFFFFAQNHTFISIMPFTKISLQLSSFQCAFQQVSDESLIICVQYASCQQKQQLSSPEPRPAAVAWNEESQKQYQQQMSIGHSPHIILFDTLYSYVAEARHHT